MSIPSFGAKHWPTEIHLNRAERTLVVAFDDGRIFTLPAELLRVQSPSAEVQGHSPEERRIVSGKRHVGITGVEAVGNYAIAISFDDQHDTGIYSWDYLYDLGADQDQVWAEYLVTLDAHGLSRDPGPVQ
ncbi:MAG: gamma-butyrobetaine hydroxylase-like domain-containing protein [Alphaproteobacteria bacterium]